MKAYESTITQVSSVNQTDLKNKLSANGKVTRNKSINYFKFCFCYKTKKMI